MYLLKLNFISNLAGVDNLFSTRAAVANIEILKGLTVCCQGFSKLDCPAIEIKNMPKSFESIIGPQYGNALHVYDAFLRYQAIRKRE